MDDRFLLICRQNYFDKVTPAGRSSYSKEGYQKVVELAKIYFEKGLYSEFAGFFQEGQYLIALWAAHMIVEYSSAGNELRAQALNVIKQYTDNPLAPTIAEEERDWIETNIGNL
jgi:hypothetical protein